MNLKENVNTKILFGKLQDVPIFYSDKQVGKVFKEVIELYKDPEYTPILDEFSNEFELYSRIVSMLKQKDKHVENKISVEEFYSKYFSSTEYKKKLDYFKFYKHISNHEALLKSILEEFKTWITIQGEHVVQEKSFQKWNTHLNNWLTKQNENRIVRSFQPMVIHDAKNDIQSRYINSKSINW